MSRISDEDIRLRIKYFQNKGDPMTASMLEELQERRSRDVSRDLNDGDEVFCALYDLRLAAIQCGEGIYYSKGRLIIETLMRHKLMEK